MNTTTEDTAESRKREAAERLRQGRESATVRDGAPDHTDEDFGGARAEPRGATEYRVTDGPLPPKEPTLPNSVWCGTLAQLNALDIPDPRILFWLAGIEIAEHETALVRGQANVYKSFLVLWSLLKAAIDGHIVLLLEGEGSKGATRKRIRRLLAGFGLSAEEIAAVMGRVYILQGPFHLVEYAAAWAALLARVKPALVVIDPLIEYNGGDENSAQEMAAFTGHVAMAKAAGAAVIVVHHSTKPDKDGKTSARGSGALRGWVDHEMVVAQADNPTTVVVAHEKNRERAKDEPRFVVWTFTDDVISPEIRLVDVEAVKADAAKSRGTWLLGKLALEGDLVMSKARGKMSGATFAELVLELEKGGKLHRFVGRGPADSLGRTRDAQLLRLGPKPSPDSVVSANPVSANPDGDE